MWVLATASRGYYVLVVSIYRPIARSANQDEARHLPISLTSTAVKYVSGLGLLALTG